MDQALYKVKKYMLSRGVAKGTISRKELDEKFGSQNIRRLMLKSYLISIGKGVTTGR